MGDKLTKEDVKKRLLSKSLIKKDKESCRGGRMASF
jgi:hypothetical protein